ncbi:MAG: acyltransferase [Thermomicrobiales bacterium]
MVCTRVFRESDLLMANNVPPTAMGKVTVHLTRWVRDFFVNSIAASKLATPLIRVPIYKAYGLDVHTHTIFPGCYFDSKRVSIGTKTVVWNDCYFGDRVTIGSGCAIAREVSFQTSSHEINDGLRRVGANILAPIIVGDGTWIGTRVTVLPGVSIGEGCVIGAGSLVTRDCEPNSLYFGSPARLVKRLP